jgi:hypothetical protein
MHRNPSQVKLLITYDTFWIVQRATAQSKTGIFRNYGVAEAPPGFQAGWSDSMYFFSLFLFILFAYLHEDMFSLFLFILFAYLHEDMHENPALNLFRQQ